MSWDPLLYLNKVGEVTGENQQEGSICILENKYKNFQKAKGAK